MTVETLDIALKKLNDEYGCLPPVVYIQLDNCSDNKSKTVLAYLYDLRRRGLLSKVTTCMLIVGHTHIDVRAIRVGSGWVVPPPNSGLGAVTRLC